MVRIVDGGAGAVPLASIRQMVPPRPLVEDLVWEGNLDVKLNAPTQRQRQGRMEAQG